MSGYKPNLPFNVAFFVLHPTIKTIKGVRQKTYTKENTSYYCSFRTFGGTEREVNDVLVVEDTATLETWFNPTIKADCRIEIDGKQYEILGTPENISMRNQFLVMKVRAIQGGA